MNFRMPPTVGAVLFVVIGIGVAAWGYTVLKNARASASWPSVTGRVTRSRVDRRTSTRTTNGRRRMRTTYAPEISYEYTVNGTTHSCDTIRFGRSGGSSSQLSAQHVVDRYPTGKEITVYYDPARPDVAVLEPGVSTGAYIPLAIGAVFVLAGIGVGVAGKLTSGNTSQD